MDKTPEQYLAVPQAGAAAVLRAQAALLARATLAEGATALAVELAQSMACSRVSIGLLDGRALDIVGESRGLEPDTRLEAAALVTAAMHEALDQAATLGFPHAGPGAAPVLMAHQMLAAAQAPASQGDTARSAACTVPVMGTEGVIGAITLERASAGFTATELALCEDIASFAGPVLELKARAAQPLWRLAGRGAAERLARLGSKRLKLLAGAAAATAVFVLAVPFPYRVSAPARLEGSVQRAVVAASDGFLQQANVRAGDTVKEGQVLAELASEDLQLERRRRESELAQHENAYRAAQSRNDRAQMVVSQAKAGEAQAMLALAESQIGRTRIVAPFDGVVIKGDLAQTVGAPVQRGEVLLTLAPNDSFRLIVEVDESDIGAVQPGQAGKLALAALPDRTLAFTVRRVVPMAASADARNYFEVEGALEAGTAGAGAPAADANRLRPGLTGVARIEAGTRTPWWQLTHRVFNWLRLGAWSVGF